MWNERTARHIVELMMDDRSFAVDRLLSNSKLEGQYHAAVERVKSRAAGDCVRCRHASAPSNVHSLEVLPQSQQVRRCDLLDGSNESFAISLCDTSDPGCDIKSSG